MLIIAKKLHELSFSSLMGVYAESNQEKVADEWKNLPPQFALQQAEQDFYLYLKEEFFKTSDACYFVWQEGNRYISALRLEPYRDGLLMEALETRPDYRRQGYGKKLVNAIFTCFPGRRIYSHVNKQNVPSLSTHQSCGFRIIMDYAAYIDGSVNYRAYTMLHE